MAQCFCGCGRKVRFGMRPWNTRGKQVRRRVFEIDELYTLWRENLSLTSPTAEELLDEGEGWAQILADAVHSEEQLGDDIERRIRDWQARCRYMTPGKAFVGRAARRSGLDVDEVAERISAGTFDVFKYADRAYDPATGD